MKYIVNDDTKVMHEACIQAAIICPQFTTYPTFERAADAEVWHYWAHQRVLWHSGYFKYLPQNVLDMFTAYVKNSDWRLLTET